MLVLGENRHRFDIWSEKKGPAVHLHLIGDVDMATSSILDSWLSGADRDGENEIVVDLSEVIFMDSSGVHSFQRAADRASLNGGGLHIINAQTSVRRVLQLTESNHLLAL